MGKSDIAIKQWLKNKERFADLFNGIIFQGDQTILPEELEKIDSESGIIISDKTGKEKGVQRYRDIVMRWKSGADLAILTCEDQKKTHYAMPVRTMLYDSLSYTEQVKQVWEEHEKRGERSTGEEFLSGFGKQDKIYPVISLVLYYGIQPWDGSTDLYGMFRSEESVRQNKLIQAYIPNYHINLADVGNLEDVKRFRTDLQVIFGMLKYRGDKEELRKYIEENHSYFKAVDLDTYRAIRELLHSKKQLKELAAERGREEKVDMCKALEDLYEEGVEKGIEKGIEKGKLVGLEEGKIAGGIETLILDNIEEGIPKECILEKLKKRFSLSREEAESFYKRFSEKVQF